MVKVHNWLDSPIPPENPSANDMRFGVGCMNELILELTGKMADLLHNVGQYTSYDATAILEKFDKATFGKQMGILKANYNGLAIKYSKMERVRDERNYFIHQYTWAEYKESDPKRLFDLINLIQTMIGQLDNANQSVSKALRKRQNKKGDNLRKSLVKAVHNCKIWDDEYAKLSDIGIYLRNNGCDYGESLQKIIESYGWKVYYDTDGPNVKYVKIAEVN